MSIQKETELIELEYGDVNPLMQAHIDEVALDLVRKGELSGYDAFGREAYRTVIKSMFDDATTLPTEVIARFIDDRATELFYATPNEISLTEW
ncbi:hypothetical protein [Haladaptatus sp. CMAA 1911]|uniref:hypothetical protein n=1 Tax=unclassified Haladaptatus TaxID=2622732 RepID=UPI003755078F